MKKKDKKSYIENYGIRCPYCKSVDMTPGLLEEETFVINQNIRCLTCHKSWTDVYTLTNIVEEEEK